MPSLILPARLACHPVPVEGSAHSGAALRPTTLTDPELGPGSAPDPPYFQIYRSSSRSELSMGCVACHMLWYGLSVTFVLPRALYACLVWGPDMLQLSPWGQSSLQSELLFICKHVLGLCVFEAPGLTAMDGLGL
jgi:hypothetical protein